MPRFPSADWFAKYCDAINASAEHRSAAADWEGDVTFVVEAEPDKGVEEETWAWLDLHHGECRSAKIVSPDEGERARYVISAPYSRWKEVITGRLDPIRGMTSGRLKLAGDLPTIVQQVEAAKILVGLAGTIPTEFPDE